MIWRMDVSSPPGVLMVITTSEACWSAARWIPLTMYPARMGSISPSMRSSTTLSVAEGEAAGAAARVEKPREIPAKTHTQKIRRRSDKKPISNAEYSKVGRKRPKDQVGKAAGPGLLAATL